MRTTNIDLQILSMLREGYSYANIESELGVSSKTIAKVNTIRKATERIESNDNKDFVPDSFQKQEDSFPFQTNFSKKEDTNPENFQPESEGPHQPFQKPDNGKIFNEDNSSTQPKSEAEIELESLQINNKHELDLKQFGWKQEKEERELYLKEQDADIERQKLEAKRQENLKKIDEKRKRFLLRFKDLAGQCKEGEWDYNELYDLLDEANILYNETREFCYQKSIPFDNTEYEKILGGICDSLENALEDAEEGEEVFWDPGIILRRQLRKVHQVEL